MYVDVGLKQTAMNVVLQVLPHLAFETNRLIRELPAGWGCRPCRGWGVGRVEGVAIHFLEVKSHTGGAEKTEARGGKGLAQSEEPPILGCENHKGSAVPPQSSGRRW